MAAVFKGYGFSVPDKILTNKDLEKIVETSDDWITERTGIKERRICEKGVSNSEMAFHATEQAIAEAGINPEELDGIIVGTVTPDMSFPSTACFLQERLHAPGAFAFDLQAACSGFIYSLDIGRRFIETGAAENLLVCGSEILSLITNFEDRGTCILFGDGCGAVVMGKGEEGEGVLASKIHSDGSMWELLYAPGWGTASTVHQPGGDEKGMYITMAGNEVFKKAVNKLVEVSREVMETGGVTIEDVDLFIPHQANKRIIGAVGKRLKIPEEKVYMNMSKYGNTSAASIPIALAEAHQLGAFKKGDLLLLAAFGAGLTWGAALVRA